MYRKAKIIASLFFLVVFFVVTPMKIAFAGNPPDAAQSSLTATTPGSNIAVADGTSQTSMTLTLKDSGGVALAGDSVTLSIPTDASAVISPTSATLDANGQAVFTITSTTIGDDTIDVTDTTTSTTLTSLGTVKFTAIPQATDHNASATPPCNQQSPLAAPDLYQVNMTGSKATLFIAPPSDVFDSFTVSYGFTSSADNYAIQFQQGNTQGAVSYAINSLTPKTTYYFKVRANNGCAAGPWSSVRQPATQLSRLPETGPSTTVMMSIGAFGAMVFAAGIFLLVL